jgi:ATP-binding cassette subfamily B protein
MELMKLTKLKSLSFVIRQVFGNAKKLLALAWKMDKRLTTAYYLTAGIGALAPLGVSLTLKFLIDSLVKYQSSVVTSVPLIIIIALSARYLVVASEDIIAWGLNKTYFDYLFRYKLQNELNYNFHEKLSSLDVAHLEDPEIQDLIRKTEDTITWRPPNFLRGLSDAFSGLVGFVSSALVLIPFGWWIPVLITLVSLPRLYFQSKLGKIQWSLYGSGAPQARKLWYFSWLLSTNTALREMKIFQSQKALLDKFKNIQNYLYDLNKKPLDDYRLTLILAPISEAAILFVIAYLKLPMVLLGVLSVGSFTLLINMIERVSGSIGSVVVSLGEMYGNSLYVNHYFEVLELPKVIKETKNPVIFEKIEPPKIEFKKVSFRYSPKEPMVLKNVSLTINPRENVAFVGPNGAGKSTIVKLICRFYDPIEGEIFINGINLKKLSLSNWYQFLGTLFQDFVCYHFTVRENIALGNPAKSDDEAIRQAAEQSGALDFIREFPKGFEQMLGREFESGEELSAGQWQKLAIARAFYEKAPVLILDEPTSAIDAEAEYEIFNNLQKVYKDKSLILVSHRFSTVRNANKIFVVEGGRIIERGTHKQLLAINGKYSRMFKLQAKGYK